MDQYAGFVIAAYGISAAGIALLIAWVVLERRAARAALERAERAAGRTGRAR